MESAVFGEGEVDDLAEEIATLSNEDLKQRIKALDTEIRIMKSDIGSFKDLLYIFPSFLKVVYHAIP